MNKKYKSFRLLPVFLMVFVSSCPQKPGKVENVKNDEKIALPPLKYTNNAEVFPPALEKTASTRPDFPKLYEPETYKKTFSHYYEPAVYSEGFCNDTKEKGVIFISFSTPMVGKEIIGKTVPPPVRISPLDGTFSWQTAELLRFNPKGPFNGIMNYQVSVPKELKSLKGETLKKDYVKKIVLQPRCKLGSKVIGWEPVSGKPQLVAMYRCGSWTDYNNNILTPEGQCIYFDQPVPAKTVRDKISVTINGVKIPYVLTEKNSKKLKIRRGQGYQILPTGTFKPGTKIVFSADNSLTSHNQMDPEKYTDTWLVRTLDVPAPMEAKAPYIPPNSTGKIIKTGNNRYEMRNVGPRFNLEFSNILKDYSVKQLQKLIKIAPTVKLTLYKGEKYISVHANLVPNRTYNLRVSEKLQDQFGYNLKSPLFLKLYPAQLLPSFKYEFNKTLEKTNDIVFSTVNISDFVVEAFPLTKDNIIKGIILSETEVGNTTNIPSAKLEKKGIKKDNNIKNHRFSLNDLNNGKKPVLFSLSKSIPEVNDIRNKGEKKLWITQFSRMGCSVKIFESELIVWLNNTITGAPLGGAELSIYNEKGVLVHKKNADNEGLVLIKENTLEKNKKIYLIMEHQGNLGYYIYKKDKAIGSGRFNIPSEEEKTQEPYPSMIFTDRGVYLPGETIHFKAFFRKGIRKEMTSVVKEVYKISLVGPGHEIVEVKEMVSNDFGSIFGSFKTLSTGRNGKYSIKISHKTIDIVSTDVKVTDFRKPKFKVEMTNLKQSIISGEKISTLVEGRYLFGAPMGGSYLSYYILYGDSQFKPAGFEQYSFSPSRKKTETDIHAYKGDNLSPDGKFLIEIPLFNYRKKQIKVTVKADVMDIDRQFVTKVTNLIIHPAAHYVGVRVSINNPAINKTTKFEAVTIDPQGKSVTGKPVIMEIYRRIYTWNWETDPLNEYQQFNEGYRDKLIVKCNVINKGYKHECNYTFKDPGLYEIVARTKDSKGNSAESSSLFFVSGEGASAMGRSTFIPINLTLDKNLYNIGETGKVLISSPFNKSRVLLTIENNKILHKQIYNVNKGVNWLEFPVIDGVYPNGFISAYLITPRSSDKKDAAGRDLGASQFRIGYAQINTKTDKYKLGVKINSSKDKARPGEKININVSLTSPDGKPVVGEVALMVVDESILSITDYKTPDPAEGFFRKSILYMRTSDSRSEMEGSFVTLFGNSHPGGGGIGGIDYRMHGDSGYIRKDFKNTIYFNPSLVTDKYGNVRASVSLPDNVTSYRIMAVAMDKNYLFGSSSSQITVSKPLMIEPALPRFLIQGDKIRAGVVAHNLTDVPIKVIVTLEAKGIKNLSDKKKSIVINPRKPVEVTFEMKAETIGEAQLTFSAKSDNGENDSVKTSILVKPFTRTRIHASTGMTDELHSITLDFPRTVLKEGTLSLEVTSNPMAPLKESVDYLIKYPYGCVEQTTSSTYPLLALMDIIPSLGGSNHTPQKLKEMAQKGIFRLLKMSTSGGLAYWPGGSDPHLYGSAYAMLAINAAVEKGLYVPVALKNELPGFLINKMNEKIEPDLAAYIVYVLSKTENKIGYKISNLYKQKNRLSTEGKSYLFMATRAENKNDPRLDVLLKEIIEGFDGNGNLKEKNKHNDEMFGSPLKTTSIALMALLESGRYNALANKLMNKIMSAQKNGHFGTTQQTVFALMALAVYAKKLNISADEPAFKVTLDGKRLQFIRVNKTVHVHSFDFPSIIAKGKQKLTVTSLKKGKPVFFTLKTKFSETPLKNYVSAYSSGVSVYKRIEDIKGQTAAKIEGGKLVRVRLFVHIPSSVGHMKYLAIDDPLPSGLEAVNTDLETTVLPAGFEGWYKLANKTTKFISFQEFREDRVLFFADKINSGFWEFTYLARGTTIGSGFVPPVSVHAMYDPEINAMSNPSKLTVTAREK